MKWCIRLILLLISIFCIRYYIQKEKQTSAFQEDVRYYFNALRKYHPAPYLHISEDSLLILETTLLNECRSFPDQITFNLRIMECNRFFDFHSNISFPSNPFAGEKIKNILARKKIIENFIIHIRQDSLFLPDGQQILSVGQHSARDLLTQSALMLPYDYPEKRRQESQPFLINILISNTANPGKQMIRLYDPRSKLTQSLSLQEVLTPEIPSWSQPLPFSFRYYPEDSIALLNYNTSTMTTEVLQKFNKEVKQFFDTLSILNIRHLFIDVRRNGGGNDHCHQEILKHLSGNKHPFICQQTYSTEGVKTLYKQMKEGKYKQFSIPSLSQEIYQQKINELPAHQKIFTKTTTYTSTSEPGEYKHPVYILQGHKTASAGSSFCWLARLCGNRIRLIGEPFADLNPSTGNVLFLNLPNTHIPFRVAIQLTYIRHDLPEKEGRLQPDLPFDFQSPDSVSRNEMQKIIKLSGPLL